MTALDRTRLTGPSRIVFWTFPRSRRAGFSIPVFRRQAMQRYIIIRMYRTEAMLSDVHDLSIEDCSRTVGEVIDWS